VLGSRTAGDPRTRRTQPRPHHRQITAYSNQVRELVLNNSGPTLTDVYSAVGEVLMGTLRWEKESEESARKARRRAEFEQKRRGLQLAEASTNAQIKAGGSTAATRRTGAELW
jgi:hypothetical protein